MIMIDTSEKYIFFRSVYFFWLLLNWIINIVLLFEQINNTDEKCVVFLIKNYDDLSTIFNKIQIKYPPKY